MKILLLNNNVLYYVTFKILGDAIKGGNWLILNFNITMHPGHYNLGCILQLFSPRLFKAAPIYSIADIA